jgi:hypothetical protein
MQAWRNPRERYDGEPKTNAPLRGVVDVLAYAAHCPASRVRQA